MLINKLTWEVFQHIVLNISIDMKEYDFKSFPTGNYVNVSTLKDNVKNWKSMLIKSKRSVIHVVVQSRINHWRQECSKNIWAPVAEIKQHYN